jgi:hypothetical protein
MPADLAVFGLVSPARLTAIDVSIANNVKMLIMLKCYRSQTNLVQLLQLKKLKI